MSDSSRTLVPSESSSTDEESGNRLSPKEKEFVRVIKMRPRRLTPNDPLFESVMRSLAEGKSLDSVGIVSLEISVVPKR
jgi:hypothetical protein